MLTAPTRPVTLGPMSDPEDDDLKTELAALRREVARLNGHRFIRIQNSVPRMVAFQMARGLAFGLGTVIGASALVSIIAFLLAQVDFIPIIGDWAADIAEQMLRELDRDLPPAQ